MNTERWRSGTIGRSHTVAHNGLIWTVSNATNLDKPFGEQVDETLAFLDSSLRQAGSGRQHILSIQVILADITCRDAFDERWRQWIGSEPQNWPQRAVFSAGLAPGLLLEVVVTAAAKA